MVALTLRVSQTHGLRLPLGPRLPVPHHREEHHRDGRHEAKAWKHSEWHCRWQLQPAQRENGAEVPIGAPSATSTRSTSGGSHRCLQKVSECFYDFVSTSIIPSGISNCAISAIAAAHTGCRAYRDDAATAIRTSSALILPVCQSSPLFELCRRNQ